MKRYRILWHRVAAALIGVVAACVAVYYIIVGVTALGSWLWSWATSEKQQEAAKDAVEVVRVSPQSLAESRRIGAMVDSLMHVPQRLDTSLIAISVYDLTTQQDVYGHLAAQLLPPASCMKIATAVAAMKTLGMNHEYRTSVLTRGRMVGDTLVGNVLLSADDDPLLDDLMPLASALRRQGIRAVRGNLWLNLNREDTLRPHPTAKIWDIPYNRTPLLLKGRRMVERQWRGALTRAGISVKKDATVRPRDRYRYIKTVCHRLRDVITPMLIHSSNIKADAVLFHLDRHQGLLPTRRQLWDIRHATMTYWQRAFADDSTHTLRGCVINDGSGLSPLNRLSARVLVAMLRHAWGDATLREYLLGEAFATPGDPVRHGSLLSRLMRPEYRGRLFCKTGTMTTIGGSSLAGYVHGVDNHWYAFAIINADSPVAESRIFQDKLCALMMTGRTRRR